MGQPPSLKSSEINIINGGMPWSDFLAIPDEIIDDKLISEFPNNPELKRCPANIVDALKAPMITEEDYNWCKWAVSPSGYHSTYTQINIITLTISFLGVK